jgi:ABC-2 type transport system permease protein
LQSLGSIVGRGDLIRKIRIPRWTIVLSASISAVINLLLNMVVVIVLMVLNHVDLLPTTLWLPLILLEVYLFALGLSLFLSAAFVKFRDLNYIWEVILQAGFYLTPIIYPLTRISDTNLQKAVLLNPLAQAMQDARWAVISHDPNIITIHKVFDGGVFVLIPFVIVLVVLVTGVSYFRKQSKYFAENI